MKILPHDHLVVSVEDVVSGFNRAPKSGDSGHVDDHEVLSKVMFDIPQTSVSVGMAYRFGGEWFLNQSSDLNVEGQPSTFSDVREFVERVGVVCVAGESHPAADGSTDHTFDSEALEGVNVYAFASGVIGLTHAVADLIQQVNTLKAAP